MATYPVEADKQFSAVNLLLHGEGAHGSSVFVDEIGNPITPTGAPVITSTLPKVGYTSIELSAGSHLSAPASVIEIGLSDFTVEAWIYVVTSNDDYASVWSWGNGYRGVRFSNAGFGYRLQFSDNMGSAAAIFNAPVTQAQMVGAWTHIAHQRRNGVCTVYLDGVKQMLANGTSGSYVYDSYPSTADYGGEIELIIGGGGANIRVDEMRITAEARYDADFTPSQEPHPDGRFAPGLEPAILDPYFAGVESLVQFDEGEGSLTLADEIDGTSWTFEGGAELIDSDGVTGSCLNVAGAGTKYIEADRPIFPATGDFTVELFAKAESYNASGENQLISQYDSSATGRALFGLQGGYLGAFLNPVGWEKSATLFPLDTWVHCAFVRSGNTLSVYQGGVLVASAAWNSSSIYTGHDAVVGAMIYQGVPQSGWDGLLDSFRFTSFARYTSAFTPPAEAFPNFEYDPLERLDLRTEVDPDFDSVVFLADLTEGTSEVTGRVIIPTAITTATSGGAFDDGFAEFNGAGSFFTTAHTEDLTATGDFTFECWINPTTVRAGTGFNSIACKRKGGVLDTSDWNLWLYGGKLRLFLANTQGSGAPDIPCPSTVLLQQWSHVAITRNGATGRWDVYLNGVFESGGTESGTQNRLDGPLYVGRDVSIGDSTRDFHGGIAHQRISLMRRYTTDFAAPTEAFPESRYIYADPGPNIVTQPVDSDLFEGQVASFTVVATGAGTIAYQWYETTAGLIAGATSATYVFSAVLGDDGKSYYCVLMDDIGVSNSDVASLAVASAHPVELDEHLVDTIMLVPFDGFKGEIVAVNVFGDDLYLQGAGVLSDVVTRFGATSLHAAEPDGHAQFPIQALIDAGFGIGDFTAEIAFWLPATGVVVSDRILQFKNGDLQSGIYMSMASASAMNFGVKTAGQNWNVSPSLDLVSGEWNDIVLERYGGTVYASINGVVVWSLVFASAIELESGHYAVIGGQATGRASNGYFADFRITNVSRYQGVAPPVPQAAFPVARFTPGLEPAILDPYFDNVDSLLHFEGEDNDTTTTDLIAGTDWVISGDGAIKQISPAIFGETCYQVGTTGRLKTTSLLSIGAGDFTIECFLLAELDDSSRYVFDFRSVWNSSTGACLRFQPGNGGTLRYYTGGADRISGSNVILGAGSPVHIALCRKDGITRLFVNGTQDGSDYADTRDYSFSVGFVWGNYSIDDTTHVGLDGLMDECRITIGAGRYGANFTVPTEAFPDFEYDPLERLDLRIDNDPHFDDIIMLCGFEGTTGDTATPDDSPAGLEIDFVNGAIISEAESAFGSSSALFTPNLYKYIRAVDFSAFDPNADWTTEGFMRPTDNGPGLSVFMHAYGVGTNNGLHVYRSSSTGYLNVDNGIVAAPASGSILIPLNEWTHIAAVRQGGTIYGFVNGVLDFTYAAQTTYPAEIEAALFAIFKTTSDHMFYGYLDEIRVTQAARYTSNFIIPAEEFPRASTRYSYAPAGPTITAHPVAESVSEGDTASFTVAATGAGTLTYQWHETTAGAIAGATASTYSFVSAVAQDGNGYFCVVTDDVGSSTSITAALAVAGALLAGVTPTTVTVYPNADPVFTCTAFGGTGTKTYQWYGPGGLELSGETGITLTLVDVVLGDNGKTFYCVVADDLDNVESNHATLAVEAPPALVVSVSPANDAAISGEDVTFTCSAVGGSGTKSYQWFESTAGALGGETGAALTITTTLPDHGNTYYCEVTDDYQTEATGIATLWVYPVLAIDAQPVGGAVGAGDPVTLTVTIAAGTAPYSYQWYQDGNAVTNETAPTLMMVATPGRAGDYTVNITDSTGQMVISDTATLTVSILAPIILTQPGSPRVNKGSSAQFEVSARGYGPLGYQWYRDGFAVSGATGYRYVLGPVTLEDDGAELYCIVTDGYGHSTQSDPGTLTVIRVHLDDQTEPMPASDIGPQKKPTYKHADFSGLVRAAKRGQSPFLPTYRFSGRTFKERE